MTPGLFQFEQWRADQIEAAAMEALQLVAAFRHKVDKQWEPTWVQTLPDKPDSAYSLEAKTSKAGRPYTIKRWCLTDVPKEGGKLGKVQGVAEQSRTIGLDDLVETPYLRANLAGAGVFWCPNVLAADAPRRTAEHVTRVAGVFLDLDGAPIPASWPLEPTATVQTSNGRYHVYFATSDLSLEDFGTIQKTLANLYGADPKVSDLPRLMRLPGYYHSKKDLPELVRLTSINPDAQYTRAELLDAWPDLVPALASAESARERQHKDATSRRAEADQLRRQLEDGTAGTRAEVQQKYGQVALLGCCADLLAAPEGQRNYTLNATAYRAGRLVGAGVLDEMEALSALREVAERIGLEPGEITASLASGLEAGKEKPIEAGEIGKFVGVKSSRKKTAPTGLAKAAQAKAEATQSQEGQPSADDVPDPEGEGGSYSDQQIKEMLSITWPVVAVDTDKAHAHRLHKLAGEDLGYVAELGGYVAWNQVQWLSGGKDGAGQVEARRHVQGLGMAMEPELDRLLMLVGVLRSAAAHASRKYGHDSDETKAARAKAEAMEKAYFQHGRAAKSTESDAKQKAILSSARTLYIKDVRDFEPRPWLVGFPNGTWDRGEFRPARRGDHMLTLAAVAYQPNADQGDWLAVLDRITGGNTDLQRTLQDVAGYALSGASSLRLLPWCYGEGGTGKGTYSEMLATVLGDMAETINPKHLATEGDRERLGAAIWGKRVALCAEAGNARLDAESLKTLSGGDRLSVRMLYAEGFTARASHVLIMVANDAPRVEAYDDALKDRVLALPFKHPLKAGGPLLGGRRLEELRQDPSSALVRGFTAWAVKGLERVYRTGEIHRAEVCLAANREFWEKVDPLSDFWPLCDPFALSVSGVPVAEFRAGYEQWAKDNGVRALSSQKFNKAAKSVGLVQETKENKRVWVLENTNLFPGYAQTDQRGGETPLTGITENTPVSQESFSSLTRIEREKDFTENDLKPVIPVSPWEGEPL